MPVSIQTSVPAHLALLSLLFLLGSCNRTAPEATAPSPPPSVSPSALPASPTPTAQPTPSTAASEAVENRLISPQGIGAAQLGMTLGVLKQQLSGAEFTVKAPFIVDFDAIAVQQNGEVQFYILYLAGQSFTDNDVIQGLWTDNPNYQTPAGVGAGTPIATAEQAYGDVTLSYNTDNESREYARFANQPAGNLSFGTGNGSANPSGIYASPVGGYNETKEYRADAAIDSILVVCLTENCAPVN